MIDGSVVDTRLHCTTTDLTAASQESQHHHLRRRPTWLRSLALCTSNYRLVIIVILDVGSGGESATFYETVAVVINCRMQYSTIILHKTLLSYERCILVVYCCILVYTLYTVYVVYRVFKICMLLLIVKSSLQCAIKIINLIDWLVDWLIDWMPSLSNIQFISINSIYFA